MIALLIILGTVVTAGVAVHLKTSAKVTAAAGVRSFLSGLQLADQSAGATTRLTPGTVAAYLVDSDADGIPDLTSDGAHGWVVSAWLSADGGQLNVADTSTVDRVLVSHGATTWCVRLPKRAGDPTPVRRGPEVHGSALAPGEFNLSDAASCAS